MVEAVKKVPGHKLCEFGANHLPAVCEGVGDSMHVLAINTSNNQTRFSQRGAAAEQKFPSIIVEGREVHPNKIVELLSVASATHQMEQDNVPKAEQDDVIQRLQKETRDMWQECAQKSSSMGR